MDLEGPIRLLYFELIFGSKATIDCLVSFLNSMHTTFDASSNEIHCHGKEDEDVWEMNVSCTHVCSYLVLN